MRITNRSRWRIYRHLWLIEHVDGLTRREIHYLLWRTYHGYL